MRRDQVNASSSRAGIDGHENASEYFRHLIWSTEEPWAYPEDENELHLPQTSPFASIFGLKPSRTRRMGDFIQAEPTRAPTAEDLDLHEYTVHQDDQQLAPKADASTKELSSRPLTNSNEATEPGEASDDEWAEVHGEDDILECFSEMISKAWYGSPLPPPLGPFARSKPRSLLRSTRRPTSNGESTSSFMPAWLKRPWQGPALLRRSRSNRTNSKPYSLRFAETVLGEDVVAAVELIQKDILENPDGDPLPDATIKFFVKAGVRVATTWAHSNLDRVFAAFGLYVAATCSAMHYTKRAVKWLAWRLPWCGKKVTGPAVTFTADVLLPTPFFGPWLATYAVLRIIITERNKALAAAKKAEAAQDAAKSQPGKPAATQPAAVAIAEAPAGGTAEAARQQQRVAAAAAEGLAEVQQDLQQQHQQQQQGQHDQHPQQQHHTRRRLLPKAGSVRLRNRLPRGRGMRSRPLSAAESVVQEAVDRGECLG